MDQFGAFGGQIVFEDWLEILLSGTYEVSTPTLAVTSGEIGTMAGSGHISWNADTGIRVQAVTDRGGYPNRLLDGRLGLPGQLIAHSTFVTFEGRTQEGWEVTADRMPRDGHRSHTDLPSVVWDVGTSGITLRRQSSVPLGNSLRILVTPLLPGWVRVTETEVRNDVFGSRSICRDWLTTTCSIGRVSARRRSADWFEVLVEPPEGESLRDAFTVRQAIARAFGFILGRRCVIRGHEEINETSETRRLDARAQQTTRNTLLPPLGRQLEFLQNVERLLALAIDFFLSGLGERVAPYLYLCWDTADNSSFDSTCDEQYLRRRTASRGR
jgi:hypothetical protein